MGTEGVRVVCVDDLEYTLDSGERVFTKRWRSLADDLDIRDPIEVSPATLSGVTLLVVHSSAMSEPSLEKARGGIPLYVLWVNSTGLPFALTNQARLCRSAIPVPGEQSLRHLRPAFARLVRELAPIPPDAEDPDSVNNRRQAWERWEHDTGQDYLLALHALCTWSLAGEADDPRPWEQAEWWHEAVREPGTNGQPCAAYRKAIDPIPKGGIDELLHAIDASQGITREMVAKATQELGTRLATPVHSSP